MQVMQICPVCQKANPTGVEYCEDCGAALTPSNQSAPVQTASSQQGAPSELPSASLTDSTASATPAAPSPASSPLPVPVDVSGPTAPSQTASAATAGVGAAVRPCLVVKRYGATTGDEIPLQGDRLLVGRFDPETGPVDVDLSSFPEAEQISRQHGELYREADGRWFVRDLGSTNGVFVKAVADPSFGPRISAPRVLANGDELAFGNARFVFRTE